METPQSMSRAWLRASLPLRLLGFHGREALSSPFRFEITALSTLADPAALLGQPACLGLRGGDGATRQIAGLITAVTTTGLHSDGSTRLELRLEPRLSLLSQRRDARVFRNLALPEIVRALLESHGYESAQIAFNLCRGYPVRPYVLQAQETGLAFVQRLLAQEGLFYWFESEDEHERLHISDHNSACPYLPGILHHRPLTGTPRTALGREIQTFQQLRVEADWIGTDFGMHALPDPLPERPLVSHDQAPQIGIAGAPPRVEEAAHRARLRREAAAAQAWRLWAQGDVVGVAPGTVASLDANYFDVGLSGDYLVTALSHRLTEPEDLSGATPSAYQLEATFIPRATPYRPPLPPRPKLPLLFPARIEASGEYAQLDELGRYRLRADFERSAHPHTEATPALQQLSPYGGPPKDLSTGLHLPLREGAQVLLSCLNDDPDRPLLVGFAPAATQPGPVTADNRPQNRLLTPGGNELLMDDARAREQILLQTFDGQTLLKLDAHAEHPFVQLACQFGALTLRALKTQRFIAGEHLSERVGSERTQLVEVKSHTTTNSAEIHHQSATEALIEAGKGALIEAGEDQQWVAGQRLRIDAERDVTVTVKGTNGSIAHIRNGEVHIQAAKSIRVRGKGGGDITFLQNGGGLKVKPDGTVQLFGKRLTLKATDGVELNGAVDYRVPISPSEPQAQISTPHTPVSIVPLEDLQASTVFDLRWGNRIVPVGEPAKLQFSVKGFRGGEAATIEIFERDASSRTLVETLTTTLDDGMGLHTLPWTPSSSRIATDLEEDRIQGDLAPLAYEFDVIISGQRAGPSNELWLSKTLIFEVALEDGSALYDGAWATLKSADGREHRAETQDGRLTFSEVVVGQYRLTLDAHEHRS